MVLMVSDFEKCAKWLLDGARDGWIVCHGMILGDDKEDVYSHCWLEFPQDNRALIMSADRLILAPADVYRDAAKAYTIDEFDSQQLRARVDKFKSFGPFDTDLKQVPHRILH